MSRTPSFRSMVHVHIMCSDTALLIQKLNQKGILLHNIHSIDYLTIALTVYQSDLEKIADVVERMDGKMLIHRNWGINWYFIRFLERKILLIGILLTILLTLLLPERLLILEVEGNQSVASAEILDQVRLCGIRFGALRRSIRNEQVKNRLLQQIPQLQWVGVNTYGCRAVISVKERAVEDVPEQQENAVCSIVAARDGVIESCTVTKGDARCIPGQAVKAGDVLISGFMDCGLCVKATRAEGEVFAQTMHQITAVTPLNFAEKGSVLRIERKFSVCIGKKRIFFYKDSGISGTVCDKMYKEYWLTLPGGYRLPVKWITEEYHVRDLNAAGVSASDPIATASYGAKAYLLERMISGKILGQFQTEEITDELCLLRSIYICTEMIGRVHNEEFITDYGKDR